MSYKKVCLCGKSEIVFAKDLGPTFFDSCCEEAGFSEAAFIAGETDKVPGNDPFPDKLPPILDSAEFSKMTLDELVAYSKYYQVDLDIGDRKAWIAALGEKWEEEQTRPA